VLGGWYSLGGTDVVSKTFVDLPPHIALRIEGACCACVRMHACAYCVCACVWVVPSSTWGVCSLVHVLWALGVGRGADTHGRCGDDGHGDVCCVLVPTHAYTLLPFHCQLCSLPSTTGSQQTRTACLWMETPSPRMTTSNTRHHLCCLCCLTVLSSPMQPRRTALFSPPPSARVACRTPLLPGQWAMVVSTSDMWCCKCHTLTPWYVAHRGGVIMERVCAYGASVLHAVWVRAVCGVWRVQCACECVCMCVCILHVCLVCMVPLP
jgi:hypothetical protein